MKNNDQLYEDKVLAGWEEVYKRGQLTFWTLLSLSEGTKTMDQVKQWLELTTKKTITVEDRSLYRVLQRFHTAELVD